MFIEIRLKANSKDYILLPINPPELGASDSNNFEDIILASGDERTIIGGKNLRTYSISSFFPAQQPRFTFGDLKFAYQVKSPLHYVTHITKWMHEKKIIYLQVTRLNINIPVTIRSFDWKEVGGSVGDIEYTLELKEYRPITYSKSGSSKSAKRPPSSSGSSKTHVVKAGESLWTISKKHYNSGNKVDAIYQLNKKIIGPNKNAIKPGMKLVLP